MNLADLVVHRIDQSHLFLQVDLKSPAAAQVDLLARDLVRQGLRIHALAWSPYSFSLAWMRDSADAAHPSRLAPDQVLARLAPWCADLAHVDLRELEAEWVAGTTVKQAIVLADRHLHARRIEFLRRLDAALGFEGGVAGVVDYDADSAASPIPDASEAPPRDANFRTPVPRGPHD